MTAGTALVYDSSWGNIPAVQLIWDQVSVYWQNLDEGRVRNLERTFADLLVSK